MLICLNYGFAQFSIQGTPLVKLTKLSFADHELITQPNVASKNSVARATNTASITNNVISRDKAAIAADCTWTTRNSELLLRMCAKLWPSVIP